jgi:hypothetical protein
MSLGAAIHALKPGISTEDAKEQAKKAERQAKESERQVRDAKKDAAATADADDKTKAAASMATSAH